MMGFRLWCTRERHREPRVVALGVEIRGDARLNNLRPYVRFYLECQKCGMTADRLREAGKTMVTPDNLILTTIWEQPA
jgi:hypothetical protein